MASKDSGPSQAVHPARPEGVSTQNRDKAIDLALAAIDKQFGKGAIMRLGKDPVEREVQVIPTGSLGLDLALGIGGLPRGRIVEIFGPESSGKTTLTLHIIAEAQKRGGVCAFIDAEHALDVGYAAEGRTFHGHVTLGRLRETRPVKDVVLPLSEQMFSDTRVDGVTLFESETKSSGSVYRDLHRISFEPAQNTPETKVGSQTGAVELGDETDDGWPRGHSH